MKLKFIFALMLILLMSCSQDINNINTDAVNDAIYQYGTKYSFLEKMYVGKLSYRELRKFGDMGLGTFNYTDGEMAAVEGKFVRIPASGSLHIAEDEMLTPFAVTKFFVGDDSISAPTRMDLAELQKFITSALTDTTKPIAFEIAGQFEYVKTRSIHKQTEPFISLEEMVANQVVFEYENTSGTIVGFWFPKYMDGVNFPSYHFHFLTKDLKGGGHLLECKLNNAVVKIDYADKLIIQ